MPARGITTIRKELTPDDCVATRKLLTYLVKIMKTNPEAFRMVMSKYILSEPKDKQDNMIEFYTEQAEFLIEHFNYQ